MDMIAFFDIETDGRGDRVLDIGAVRSDGGQFHGTQMASFADFIRGVKYVAGHNIIRHDLKYVREALQSAGVDSDINAIDTLYLSPLLFPRKPYHNLLKDDKLQVDELNNPLNDSIKARDLFNDEMAAFARLDEDLKSIFGLLLSETPEFRAFFRYVGWKPKPVRRSMLPMWFSPGTKSGERQLANMVRSRFSARICEHADLESMIRQQPVALAYSLALIDVLADEDGPRSVSPPWLLRNYPEVTALLFRLRNTPCLEGCGYCGRAQDIHAGLKKWFGYDAFRSYDDEPLQERAAQAAVDGKSILAIFPTGGGKSLTFQLPALMAGENAGGLTVVISPLQSLMKDQVDNLEARGITEAVTINGLLNPIERAKSFERVEDGSASLLYISPESLRSKTIEKAIIGRNIARFVIDEAHCFSAWGQDFRVDYLYIADFIRMIQEKKHLQDGIPISCFTATAKPAVIEDIRGYFRQRLGVELQVFAASVSRDNLRYKVLPVTDDKSKYQTLRNLLESRECPSIVYVSRTRKAEDVARQLCDDGFRARPYHGKLSSDKKIEIQNEFMSGNSDIIVATSAFGMGVDKKDVGLVVHYDISDSLENYIQEAGRAGRDENIEAECFVLFNEEDLSKHFILLNQTKLNIKEIQQVWKAVKDLTKFRSNISNSALEIARKAGWDDSIDDIETKVKTALASLEQSGYLKRGQNSPRVYATGIQVRTAQEAIDKIETSPRFTPVQKTEAVRIIKRLISARSVKRAQGEDAETRVDYISDHLGIPKKEVLEIIDILKEENILADSSDMQAYIQKDDSETKAGRTVRNFAQTEFFLSQYIREVADSCHDSTILMDFKELSGIAEAKDLKYVDANRMRIILNFWAIKGWIKKKRAGTSNNHCKVEILAGEKALDESIHIRHELAEYIVRYLYERKLESDRPDAAYVPVEFSVLSLTQSCRSQLLLTGDKITREMVEDTLFFLSRTGAVKLEGGFLVIYNALTIERLENDNKKNYKKEDYSKLEQFYSGRMQQIHIVGEYARKMISDYRSALQFVDDYFQMSYPMFLRKYFNGRREEISQNITPAKFKQIFGVLSPAQLKIIQDKNSKYIVVLAGPGSGKTGVLVHKLASLLLMEDVKHEQLLMLTFSRAAATEFKKRLYGLIGNAAAFVEIKTFHSYCFDILGKIGNLTQSGEIVRMAVEKIRSREIDLSRITKTVLVIDEAQDMDADSYALMQALMECNEDMRVIAVGDDDQNIYEFRGSSSSYLGSMLSLPGVTRYELMENFRSRSNLVEFADSYAHCIGGRFKNFPIVAKNPAAGELVLVHHGCEHMEEAVIEHIVASRPRGTVCVMTRTNKEATQLFGMLVREGLPARLIQSLDGFGLQNLAEIRYFMQCVGICRGVGDETGSPVIEDYTWAEAKKKLEEKYRGSTNLDMCRTLIEEFEQTNVKVRYKSDFESFVKESSPEDFVRTDASSIVVSTMHKTKGKEFDNVFLMLNAYGACDDAQKRTLYVAMTRAKSNMYIHLNNSILDGISAGNPVRMRDDRVYGAPETLTFMLSYKDVWLDDFKLRQSTVASLKSGDILAVDGDTVYDSIGKPVLKFSKKFRQERDRWLSDGYEIYDAHVEAMLWWKGKGMDSEILIVLPCLRFRLR